MRSSELDFRKVVTSLTLAAVVVLGLSWALWSLSQPKNAGQRLAAVSAELAAANRAGALRGEVGRFPPGAVCASIAEAPQALKVLGDAAAAKAGVVLGEARTSYLGQGAEPMLALMSVEIAAKGQEAPLKVFLQTLANRAPSILADSVDLSSDGTEVSLHIKGRFLCHDRRLP